jgi:hypothetical protein
VAGVVFGWITVRHQQAIEEGLSLETCVRSMDHDPQSAAIVNSILLKLADQPDLDWSKPLVAWSKAEISSLVWTIWRLLAEADAALQASNSINNKSKSEPEPGMVADPAKEGIPLFLQTQNTEAQKKSEPELDDEIPF